MPLSSMTGFTRVAGQHESVDWIWEIRSVNGKGLDLRVRLPYGYEALEAIVRDAAGKILKR
ncbi:MAG: YicC/YloC family endoribonuclease, partial [Pseudomonadota bacterium]